MQLSNLTNTSLSSRLHYLNLLRVRKKRETRERPKDEFESSNSRKRIYYSKTTARGDSPPKDGFVEQLPAAAGTQRAVSNHLTVLRVGVAVARNFLPPARGPRAIARSLDFDTETCARFANGARGRGGPRAIEPFERKPGNRLRGHGAFFIGTCAPPPNDRTPFPIAFGPSF